MVITLVLLNTASPESCTVPRTWWALSQHLFDPCPGSPMCSVWSFTLPVSFIL